MSDSKEQNSDESDVLQRRRGRPAGRNRIPLSREERRARNAQYERERRNETAEAMSQLIEAAQCDSNISNADLLATVISRIQTASEHTDDISDLERINAQLEDQIMTLQGRLGLDDASLEQLDDESDDLNTVGAQTDAASKKQRKKRKLIGRQSSERLAKRTKRRSETLSVDSGIELRSHTASPPDLIVQENVQYQIHTEEQLPVEISEKQEHNVSQEYLDLQSELYNQIYNPESQSSAKACDVGTVTSQSVPSIMETLYRSLIVPPPIKSPRRQQEPPGSRVDHESQPELGSQQNIESPCDVNIANDGFLTGNDDQPSLDLFTDSEKRLLSEWLDVEYRIDLNGIADNIQTQVRVRNHPFDNF